jgi:hypothetical protein
LSAPTRAGVDAAYAAAMASGGCDEGRPGLRPHFAPNYYAAYVRDPVLPLRYPRRRYRVQREPGWLVRDSTEFLFSVVESLIVYMRTNALA